MPMSTLPRAPRYWGAFVNAWAGLVLSVEALYYVHRNLYAAFLQACAEKTKKLRVGPGMDRETDVGPMIHERQLRTAESQVEDAVARGARVLAGGSRLPELGQKFLYADGARRRYPRNAHHARGNIRSSASGDAIRSRRRSRASGQRFRILACGRKKVDSKQRCRGERLARRIQAGTVMVNDVVSCFGISEAPHGGVKSSGLGRTHGRFGLEEMVRLKYLDTDRTPGIKKVWWYGYGVSLARQMADFLDFQFARGLAERLRGAICAAPLSSATTVVNTEFRKRPNSD